MTSDVFLDNFDPLPSYPNQIQCGYFKRKTNQPKLYLVKLDAEK